MFDLLWPNECAGCGTPGPDAICRACCAGVELRPVPYAGLTVFTVAPYHSAIAAVLRRAKYGGGDRRCCQALGPVLAERCGAFVGAFRSIVPVPSPWTRRFQRGFSVPSLLAGSVSKVIRAPVVHALTMAMGPAQASLDGVRRRTNLSGRVRARRGVRGPVLLVDDAVTTGATARACTEALLAGGATEVVVLCLVSTDA